MKPGPSELPPGLYESLITEGLERRLSTLDDRLLERVAIHRAEAPSRFALHLGRLIENVIAAVPDADRVEVGMVVARDLIAQLDRLIESADLDLEQLVEPGQVLRSITTLRPDGSPKPIDSPLIPLLDTTLLTNAPGEPRVGHQVVAEIGSAGSIDVLMAFIRTSGINPLREALKRHCDAGGALRVLTTTYTGSTQREALDRLTDLGAEVRISYDVSSTRLHAKAWLFRRASGFSTAYIGSSNLTYSAQVSGLEWNVRVSGARNPDVIDKVRAVFDTYWENPDFRAYNPDEFDQMTERKNSGPTIYLSPVAITPLPFQQRLLEQLALSRSQGHHRNLIASATGTGKTVMAALDYVRLQSSMPRCRLLFVAHRQEILDQSQATFRHALRDPSFGEQWIGGRRPIHFEHVFASVQSLHRMDLDNLPSDHFDVVIVDEFHHAAAQSYDRLLQHLRPVELLGLTATPERSDGLPVLHWFDDRIAAELRLWDAIDQHYLTPFTYYGIHDGLDLREVPWHRGRGYDADGLTALYTASDVWARQVVKEFIDRVDDIGTAKALGFCVNVEHARFMARIFNEAGISAAAVWADTSDGERAKALTDLAQGRLRVLFSVDLFNEGVDVPTVDTLLMLRPTDSPTLFLQQLGRGLRRSEGKTVCTVLDFVGTHRKEFRFDRRMRALLGGTRKDVAEQIKARFPYLPAGCHMELDEKSAAIVLESIKSSIPSGWSQKVEELRALVVAGHAPTLATYLEHSGLELDDVYTGGRGWSELCEAAGVALDPPGPHETVLRRAVGRLLHVDDNVRISGYRSLLTAGAADGAPRVTLLNESGLRVARMLVSQLVDQVPTASLPKVASLQEGIDLVWRHPQVRHEVLQLLDVLGGLVDHVHPEFLNRPGTPLQVHARYTRLEILAGFNQGEGPRVAPWQTGVQWVPGEKADLLAFTLDKTEGSFSPTTRYRDYALSRDLIHWESQSVTRADSDTGLRYQQHADRGSEVILFARLLQSDRAFWCLGPATYVRHEGERPMSITWRLKHPLPGDLFTQFAAAVA